MIFSSKESLYRRERVKQLSNSPTGRIFHSVRDALSESTLLLVLTITTEFEKHNALGRIDEFDIFEYGLTRLS